MSANIRLVLLACLGTIFATSSLAQELPADVKSYIDRRTGCNYWPSEPATTSSRKTEIARHIRDLRCNTLDHDESEMNARYRGKPEILTAVADAHDAMPD
jgi:hypothetical protein